MAKSLIRPTSKGQITIPKEIRNKLSINTDTYLDVSLEGKRIVLQPVDIQADNARSYTAEEISGFVKYDVLSPENVAFLKQILKTKKG